MHKGMVWLWHRLILITFDQNTVNIVPTEWKRLGSPMIMSSTQFVFIVFVMIILMIMNFIAL